MKDVLWQLTAIEVVELLKSGKVTPLDCLDVLESKIQETEHLINAIPIVDFARAREAARKLMQRGHPASPPPGYLYGLPVLIKDLNPVAGMRYTQGFVPFANRVPSKSDAMVLQIEAKGGIVYGKSNVPEFGAGSQTFNGIFGSCKSPFDLRTTAGGSSGGSAAALASGTSWLASGSDLGGSLRIPAAFTGTVGFRTTPGLVADGGVSSAKTSAPFMSLHSVNGPMARNVLDTALFLDTLRAPEGSWSFKTSPPPKTSRLSSYKSFLDAALAGVGPLKVAFSPDLGFGPSICPTDPEIVRICEQAANWFANIGAKVLHDQPDMTESVKAFHHQRALDFARLFGSWMDQELGSHLKPEIQWNARMGLDINALARPGENPLLAAQAHHAAFAKSVDKWFEDKGVDLLITPAVMCLPFDVTKRYLTSFRGVQFTNYLGWMVLSWTVTATQCPALVLPCGLTVSGLPVGLQLIGRCHDDAFVLSAARLFEQAHFYHRCVPLVPRIPPSLLPVAAGVSTSKEALEHHLRAKL